MPKGAEERIKDRFIGNFYAAIGLAPFAAIVVAFTGIGDEKPGYGAVALALSTFSFLVVGAYVLDNLPAAISEFKGKRRLGLWSLALGIAPTAPLLYWAMNHDDAPPPFYYVAFALNALWQMIAAGAAWFSVVSTQRQVTRTD